MRIFAALSLLLGGGQARYEVIDLSKMTCKQFFDTHIDEPRPGSTACAAGH